MWTIPTSFKIIYMEYTGNGDAFMCCGRDNTPLNPFALSSLVHCLPITVPVGDPQLRNTNDGCMNFVRSSTGPNRISCYLPFVSYTEQVILPLQHKYDFILKQFSFFSLFVILVESKQPLAWCVNCLRVQWWDDDKSARTIEWLTKIISIEWAPISSIQLFEICLYQNMLV